MKRWLSSLRFHILLPVLAMMLLMAVLITAVVSRSYIDMNLRQEREKNAALFELIGRQIDGTVTNAVSDARSIMIDERITAYVRHSFRTYAELMHARVACRDYLRTEIDRHSAIYGLLFMRPDGSLFGALPYSNVFEDDGNKPALPAEIIDQVRGLSPKQTAWIGPVTGTEIYGYKSAALPDTIVIAAWKTAGTKTGEYYTLMLMDDSVFEAMLSLLPEAGELDAALHLFSADGRELFHTGGDSGLDREMPLSGSNDGTIVRNARDESYCVFSMPLSIGGWTLMRVVSIEDSRRAIRSLQRTIWRLVGLALLIALGVYYCWLRRFMQSFNALRDDIIRLGQGAPVSDEPSSIAEFESMRRELKRASLSLKEHMETIRHMEHEKLELELNDLHGVLAPHMIFNSITAIRWMATFLGAEPVADMLIELGAVIRPVLRQWRVQWTIREELEHVSHYTKLLDLRFANNFKLEQAVDAGLEAALIPQFTLQPLIENAAQHGGNPEGPLVTTVRVTDEGEWIRLTVADNGESIEPEKIGEIRADLRAGTRENGIGLINVYSRLVLCKGQDSTLDIEALPEGGTMVTLRWRKDAQAEKGIGQMTLQP